MLHQKTSKSSSDEQSKNDKNVEFFLVRTLDNLKSTFFGKLGQSVFI